LDKYRIVYFSGTGCTALAASCLEEALRERGCETVTERIVSVVGGGNFGAEKDDDIPGTVKAAVIPGMVKDDDTPCTVKDDDIPCMVKDDGTLGIKKPAAVQPGGAPGAGTLVLLFPVHACTAPGPVMEWLRELGGAEGGGAEGGGRKGAPATVISVSGGGEISPNTASRVSAIKMLEKKGYDVFCEDTLVMPSNIAIATPEPLSILLLQVLPDKARAIADGILSGGRKRKAPFVIDRFLAWAGKAERGSAKKWGRSIKASDECDGCGLCAEQCPTGNITMTDSKPGFSEKCCMCLGCFYACTKKALTPKTAKTMILKGFNLKAIEEKALVSERADAAQIPASLIWLGVKRYLKEKEKN